MSGRAPAAGGSAGGAPVAGLPLPLAIAAGDFVELVWVSTTVTLVVVTAFALAIRGTARASDLRREGRGAAAAGQAAMAALCYAVVAASIVAGVAVIALG